MTLTQADREAIWHELRSCLEELRSEVVRQCPRVTAQIGQHSTDAFPLGVFAGFSSSGDPADEDLVVSVDAHREGGRIRCSSDIALGDGTVIATGPEATLKFPVEYEGELRVWVRDVCAFIRSNTDTVAKEL